MNNTEAKNRTCAVIPFYNEQRTIREVIFSSLRFTELVIAVNDGSTDNSELGVPVIPGVYMITLDQNKGKGFALRKGLLKARELGYDFAVTLDADMQHPPEYIPGFVESVGNNDLVIGNRLSDMSTMPIQRRLSNYLTSALLTYKCGVEIKDSQCGYRIYRLQQIEKILSDKDGFDFESEIIVKAARNNFKIAFLDIPTIYGNEDSKMKAIRTIIGFIRILLSR